MYTSAHTHALPVGVIYTAVSFSRDLLARRVTPLLPPHARLPRTVLRPRRAIPPAADYLALGVAARARKKTRAAIKNGYRRDGENRYDAFQVLEKKKKNVHVHTCGCISGVQGRAVLHLRVVSCIEILRLHFYRRIFSPVSVFMKTVQRQRSRHRLWVQTKMSTAQPFACTSTRSTDEKNVELFSYESHVGMDFSERNRLQEINRCLFLCF